MTEDNIAEDTFEDADSEEAVNFSQDNIISCINEYLENDEEENEALDNKGCCSALVTLFLQQNTSLFKEILNTILDIVKNSDNNEEDKNNTIINDFVEIIKRLNKIHKFSQEIQQSDVDKAITHLTKELSGNHFVKDLDKSPLNRRTAISYIFSQSELTSIFKRYEAIKEDKLMYIGSLTHAVGIKYEYNKYHLYDPNNSDIDKEFNSAEELVKELFLSLNQHKESKFIGLSIDIFSKNAQNSLYPDSIEIIQSISDPDIKLNDRKDEDGNTPLHLASYNNHYHLVNYLIKNKIEIDAVNKNKTTPLFMAIGKGHKTVADLLVKNNASLIQKNINDKNILMKAVGSGNIELIKTLVNYFHEGNKLQEILNEKTKYDENIVSYILAFNDIKPFEVTDKTYFLNLILHSGSPQMLNELLNDAGFNSALNKPDFNGNPILHNVISAKCKIEILTTLIEKVDINATDKNGNTALHLASELGDKEFIKILLEKGANSSIKNNANKTPAELDKNGIIEQLIQEQQKIARIHPRDDNSLGEDIDDEPKAKAARTIFTPKDALTNTLAANRVNQQPSPEAPSFKPSSKFK